MSISRMKQTGYLADPNDPAFNQDPITEIKTRTPKQTRQERIKAYVSKKLSATRDKDTPLPYTPISTDSSVGPTPSPKIFTKAEYLDSLCMQINENAIFQLISLIANEIAPISKKNGSFFTGTKSVKPDWKNFDGYSRNYIINTIILLQNLYDAESDANQKSIANLSLNLLDTLLIYRNKKEGKDILNMHKDI